MLGSFAAAFVLGIPARFVVITTAIWQAVTMYPADYGRAAALGIALFAVMFLSLSLYRVIIRRGNFATITGKAFRPRRMAMGRMAWVLFALCLFYVFAAVILPLGVLLLTSFERFATVILSQAQFTLANYEAAFGFARDPPRADQQPDPRRRGRHGRRRDHGGAGVDHLPLAGSRAHR